MPDHVYGGLHCREVEDLAASFVLGSLEADEAGAVRAHLAACPEPHPEMAELGSVVPALLESLELVAPPADLKRRILAAAATDLQAAPDAQRVGDTQRTPVGDIQRTPGGFFGNLFRRPIWAGVALAAVVALVAIGVGYTSLRTQVDDLTAYRNAVAAVLKDAVEPGAQLAVLKPAVGSTGPGGFAAVGDDGAVMLVMHDLAPTAGAQVYEAWLIAGQSAPVPIGAFTVSKNGTASFATAHASLGDGVTVALSLEPGPGATTPTQVV
ncbi:MAG TPA: anti-sigma factor, partial [Candidatus Limnocylindrales bacterium]|nr:anti-sigma factor [Candidatus Limnocylindrales bacterium]